MCSTKWSQSLPNAATMKCTRCSISPLMKCTLRDRRSSLDTISGHRANFASFSAVASPLPQGFLKGESQSMRFSMDRAGNAVVTAGAGCKTLRRMDEKAIRLAAMVTVQRTIQDRFPAGRQRTAWLRWFSLAASMTERESVHGRLHTRSAAGISASDLGARRPSRFGRSTKVLGACDKGIVVPEMAD
jgi:hypothetical protein